MTTPSPWTEVQSMLQRQNGIPTLNRPCRDISGSNTILTAHAVGHFLSLLRSVRKYQGARNSDALGGIIEHRFTRQKIVRLPFLDSSYSHRA